MEQDVPLGDGRTRKRISREVFLNSSHFSVAYQTLPDSIQNLIALVVRETQPEKILLFGSRARGDHRQSSDFDIAVKSASPIPGSSWAKLQVAVEEDLITLYRVDLVDFDKLPEDYKKRILVEGKTLYAR